MTQKLIIPGTLPGLNEIIAAAKSGTRRRGARNWKSRPPGIAYAQLKQALGKKIVALIRQQQLVPMARVHLVVHWVEPNRRRDPDNIRAGSKFWLDALVKAGILAGDGHAQIAGITDHFNFDAERPRVEIYLVLDAAP